jgi:hypothetical protein
MKLQIPLPVLAQSIVFMGLVCGVASGAEQPRDDENGSRKVEFAEVEGHPCLQPVVRSADADLQDFRVAERRWLSDHFPGEPALRWQVLLVSVPDVHRDGQYATTTVKSESTHIHLADGWEIEVCFDVGVDMPKKDVRE